MNKKTIIIIVSIVAGVIILPILGLIALIAFSFVPNTKSVDVSTLTDADKKEPPADKNFQLTLKKYPYAAVDARWEGGKPNPSIFSQQTSIRGNFIPLSKCEQPSQNSKWVIEKYKLPDFELEVKSYYSIKKDFLSSYLGNYQCGIKWSKTYTELSYNGKIVKKLGGTGALDNAIVSIYPDYGFKKGDSIYLSLYTTVPEKYPNVPDSHFNLYSFDDGQNWGDLGNLHKQYEDKFKEGKSSDSIRYTQKGFPDRVFQVDVEGRVPTGSQREYYEFMAKFIEPYTNNGDLMSGHVIGFNTPNVDFEGIEKLNDKQIMLTPIQLSYVGLFSPKMVYTKTDAGWEFDLKASIDKFEFNKSELAAKIQNLKTTKLEVKEYNDLYSQTDKEIKEIYRFNGIIEGKSEVDVLSVREGIYVPQGYTLVQPVVQESSQFGAGSNSTLKSKIVVNSGSIKIGNFVTALSLEGKSLSLDIADNNQITSIKSNSGVFKIGNSNKVGTIEGNGLSLDLGNNNQIDYLKFSSGSFKIGQNNRIAVLECNSATIDKSYLSQIGQIKGNCDIR